MARPGKAAWDGKTAFWDVVAAVEAGGEELDKYDSRYLSGIAILAEKLLAGTLTPQEQKHLAAHVCALSARGRKHSLGLLPGAMSRGRPKNNTPTEYAGCVCHIDYIVAEQAEGGATISLEEAFVVHAKNTGSVPETIKRYYHKGLEECRSGDIRIKQAVDVVAQGLERRRHVAPLEAAFKEVANREDEIWGSTWGYLYPEVVRLRYDRALRREMRQTRASRI